MGSALQSLCRNTVLWTRMVKGKPGSAASCNTVVIPFCPGLLALALAMILSVLVLVLLFTWAGAG